MNTVFKFTIFLFTLSFALTAYSANVVISSPDHKTTVIFKIDTKKQNASSYSVMKNGKVIIAESPLGLEFENQTTLKNNLRIVSTKQKNINAIWKPVYGERGQYPDQYNEVVIELKETKTPYRSFSMTFRAYNEGIAFKYSVPNEKTVVLSKELTGFRFQKDFVSWVAGKAQAKYLKTTISKTGKGCERPYVIEINQNCYVALGEAALTDNSRMKFDRAAEDSLLLMASYEGKPVFNTSFSTPWRYVMLASSPGALIEHNYLVLNLNAPNAIKDVSWIKPGKVIREVTLTTTGGKACIDFAAKHNLQYIEFDAGWYGPENNGASDATAVKLDPARSAGPLDLQEVINYGKSKNVGVILYVNQKALTKQLDTILPLYQSWGVKGIKYGFVNVGLQQPTHWLYEAVEKASKYKILLDIHDEFRPTGFSRTYPNLLTQEGIRGDEESPGNQHVLITMFTRMIAGAGDHTNCYFAPRIENMGSHASQMAKAICLYSPWQFIYWYDRPEDSPRKLGGAGSSASVIAEIPDLTFYDALPTVWDDTKVLEGKIGEYATIARKSGNNWFIGSMTDQPRTLALSFSFLNKQKQYEATIYADDAQSDTPTHIKISKQKVTSSSKLLFQLKAKNGVAIILKEK
jgi:alpha-glucosidase